MSKFYCCFGCKYFDTNNGIQGLCFNNESDYLGFVLPAKHKCNKYTVSDDKKEIMNNFNLFARGDKHYEK